VPCFTGLFTPHWDPSARGTICGLSHASTKAHIARAALKAVAFQTAEMVEAMEKDMKDAVETLRIDGGMTANRLFNQLQSDTLGKEITCSRLTEVTGWGIAIAAALGAGIMPLEHLLQNHQPQVDTYRPNNTAETRECELVRWKLAVERSRSWIRT